MKKIGWILFLICVKQNEAFGWNNNNNALEKLDIFSLEHVLLKVINKEDKEEVLTELFRKMDENGDEILTKEEFRKFANSDSLKKHLSYTAERNEEKIDQEFRSATLDLDGNGNFTKTEYILAVSSWLTNQTVSIPTNNAEFCKKFKMKLNNCSLEGSEQLVSFCTSGIGWIVNQNSFESCVISNKYECSDVIKNCFTTAETPLKIRKRQFWEDILVPFFLQTLFPHELGSLVIALCIYTIILLIITTAVSTFKTHKTLEDWDKTSFYRWKIGEPEPPCGAPILFWNGQCGFQFSKKATTCVRGVPYFKDACKWFSLRGARKCEMIGFRCEMLCMDISTGNCISQVNLSYDLNGYGFYNLTK
jgi:hypothetical protein